MPRVDGAISTLEVAHENNVSCFNSKSEFFSGFKIIKVISQSPFHLHGCS